MGDCPLPCLITDIFPSFFPLPMARRALLVWEMLLRTRERRTHSNQTDTVRTSIDQFNRHTHIYIYIYTYTYMYSCNSMWHIYIYMIHDTWYMHACIHPYGCIWTNTETNRHNARHLVATCRSAISSGRFSAFSAVGLPPFSKVKIADFNCAEECPGPNFEIFDAQGCGRGVSLGKICGVWVMSRQPSKVGEEPK